MPVPFEARELELKRVFGDDYLFEIPPYQRPYDWTTEETETLFNDLFNAMGEAAGEIENAPPYFLGSIVLIKESPSSSLVQIIDGQQRLTTLTMLLCVLRELSYDDRTRDDLDVYVRERGNTIAGTQDRFRLSVRDRDLQFFRENVQAPGGILGLLNEGDVKRTDSQSRMFDNTKLLYEKLVDLGKDNRERLAMFIMQRCFLIVVSANDRPHSYRIFSVMNTRGRELYATDILKADVIGGLPEDTQREFMYKWEEIEDELGRDRFRDLFAHIYVIFQENRAHRQLDEAFKKDVLEAKQLDSRYFIDAVLRPYANAYKVITDADYESNANADKINAYLKQLGRLDDTDWIPPVMAFYKRDQASESLLRFLREFDRLAYGLLLQRTSRDPRIRRYSSVLSALEKEEDIYGDDGPLQLSTFEKANILRTLNGDIYENQPSRFTRPLLLRIDSMLADSVANYEHDVVTVEHVLPQQPKEDSEWFKPPWDENLRNEWVHKLANLVLLSRRKNSQANNREFSHKKEAYFVKKSVTTFALTSQVISQDKWTPEVLELRQMSLIDELKREWRLE